MTGFGKLGQLGKLGKLGTQHFYEGNWGHSIFTVHSNIHKNVWVNKMGYSGKLGTTFLAQQFFEVCVSSAIIPVPLFLLRNWCVTSDAAAKLVCPQR